MENCELRWESHSDGKSPVNECPFKSLGTAWAFNSCQSAGKGQLAYHWPNNFVQVFASFNFSDSVPRGKMQRLRHGHQECGDQEHRDIHKWLAMTDSVCWPSDLA